MHEFFPIIKLINSRENEIPTHPVKIFEKIQRNDSSFLNVLDISIMLRMLKSV